MTAIESFANQPAGRQGREAAKEIFEKFQKTKPKFQLFN